MAKWTKQPKQTNNSLPLVAANKKITSAEFNELTEIINANFDATVAPIDVVYGRQGENWVGIPSGGGGINPADIVNDFNTDPDNPLKVAGADAVFSLFQIIESNDETISFESIVNLDQNSQSIYTIVSPVSYTLGVKTHILNRRRVDVLIADGINKPTFATEFTIVYDGYNNTAGIKNIVTFQYLNNDEVAVYIQYAS